MAPFKHCQALMPAMHHHYSLVIHHQYSFTSLTLLAQACKHHQYSLMPFAQTDITVHVDVPDKFFLVATAGDAA
eukprot:1666308-Karenia_brevis.AAC.1